MKILKAVGVLLFFSGLIGWILFAVIRHQGNDFLGNTIIMFPWMLVGGLFIISIHNFSTAFRKRSIKKNASGLAFGSFFLFFCFVSIFVTGILTVVILNFPKSAAFAELKRNLENDPKAIEKFGEIRYYGIFPEGRFGTEIADFHLMVYGEKQKSTIYFLAHLENGNWVVDDLSY